MILKKIVFTFIISLMSIGIFAQKSMPVTGENKKGKIVTKIDDFKSIQNNGPFDITYKTSKDSAGYIVIYGKSNIIDKIDIDNSNGVLTLKFPQNIKLKNERIKIALYSSNINTVNINGSGNLNIPEELTTNELLVNLRGSGNLRCPQITCKRLNVNILGSGDVSFDANTIDTEISIMGSGDVKISNLEAKNTSLSVKGSGDINCRSLNCDNLSISSTGSGDIMVAGRTKNARYESKGSGDIIAGNMNASIINAKTVGSGDINCYAEDAIETVSLGSGDIRYRGNPVVTTTTRGSGSVKKL